jgi:hypothetical protein
MRIKPFYLIYENFCQNWFLCPIEIEDERSHPCATPGIWTWYGGLNTRLTHRLGWWGGDDGLFDLPHFKI